MTITSSSLSFFSFRRLFGSMTPSEFPHFLSITSVAMLSPTCLTEVILLKCFHFSSGIESSSILYSIFFYLEYCFYFCTVWTIHHFSNSCSFLSFAEIHTIRAIVCDDVSSYAFCWVSKELV